MCESFTEIYIGHLKTSNNQCDKYNYSSEYFSTAKTVVLPSE